MADWEVIEEKPHSEWGASQTHKRMNCLGSLHMEARFPNETSIYAAEGTKAHGLAETMVKAAIMDNWKPNGTRRAVERSYFFNRHVQDVQSATDMMEAAEDYVAYIRGILHEHPEAKIHLLELEHAFDMSSLRPDLYGTCDCIVIIEWIAADTGEIVVELHIVDFKYGQGVQVGARENSQLAYYALGAYRDLWLLHDITRVTLHIVQPRVKNFDSWSTTVQWLTEDFQDYLCARWDLSQAEDAPRTPGSWCHDSFCRARGFCPDVVKAALQVNGDNKLLVRHVWESDALAMEMIGVVRAWAKAREDEIKRKIMNHEKTDATAYFKVVNGRSSRDWDDAGKLAVNYPSSQYPDFWHEPEFRSVAQIEKAIKADQFGLLPDWDQFEKHVVVTPGAPTIARLEDSRVAVDKVDQAKNEFLLEDKRNQTEAASEPDVEDLINSYLDLNG